MHELIRASTFARLKHLAPRSVRRMLQDRGMPGKKRGATWYVETTAATEWLAQNSPRTTAREKGSKVRPKSPPKRPPAASPPEALEDLHHESPSTEVNDTNGREEADADGLSAGIAWGVRPEATPSTRPPRFRSMITALANAAP